MITDNELDERLAAGLLSSGKRPTRRLKIATSVTIIPSYAEYLLKLGDGNMSRGLERAITKLLTLDKPAAPTNPTDFD